MENGDRFARVEVVMEEKEEEKKVVVVVIQNMMPDCQGGLFPISQNLSQQQCCLHSNQIPSPGPFSGGPSEPRVRAPQGNSELEATRN
jgi:hypothetical protein